ncbi:MAG TPA: hypothetical protein VHU84_16560 [Lacipirellulaceae bacterium]|jgi:hypothetical protein|nr:hypothetical protein [Lacipirellulaceae bacterium]
MDHWHAHVARCDRPTAVERWASLEAKSETMQADLVRQHTVDGKGFRRNLLTRALFIEVALTALDTWLHARSR